MTHHAEVDYGKIRKLYGASAAARATLDYFAGRTNASRKTTLNRLLAALQADGAEVTRADVREVLKSLEQLGCGRFVVGRKGHPSRFVWEVNLVHVGQVANGERDQAEPLTDAPGEAQARTEDDGLLEHRYRLRADVEVRLELPANISGSEANRLADFIRTLPFV